MAQLEMLRYLHDHDLVRISDRQPENWEEAIRISCENLIDKGSGVFGTAISFTKFKEKIYFEAGNEEKQASLFFTLAAKNPDEHMTNIANLSDLLMTDGVIEALDKITTISDFESLLQ